MSKNPETPLRGEAAWRAAKQEIADKNAAACARGREQRTAREEQKAAERRAAERRELANLPKGTVTR
jgi:hypothetical protein